MIRRFLPALGLAAGALIFLPLSHAQEPVLKPFRTDDRPVMRPEPVRPPRVLPAEPVRPPRVLPAEPVAPPPATPALRSPGRKGRPIAAPLPPPPEPAPSATPVPAEPEPADPGQIRMSPQTGARTPEQAQIEVADSYYTRKMYDIAAPEYQRYLDNFPGGAEVPAAMFRLAESHRQNGSVNSAKSTYENLLARFPVGEFVGPAAYRLADLYYKDRNFTSALPFYRKASARLKEPSVVNAAKFYSARCLEATGGTGTKLEATDLYRDLADAKDNHPFREASRLSLALLLKDNNRTAEALKHIQLLAKQTENPSLQAEAVVRAGLWELELEQHAKAAEDLKKGLAMPGVGKWKEPAQLGMLRIHYDTAKYQQVLDGFDEYGKQIGPDAQPELLLLVANSHRQLNHPTQALELYEKILRDYPGSVYAKDADYQRLVTLYNASSDKLVGEIDAFLAANADAPKRDQVLLMKAEFLFKKDDFAGAGPVYSQVSQSLKLTGTLKAEAIYKLGWCSMQTRDFDVAIKAFTRFVDEHPTNKSLCSARVQRAIANQSLKNLAAAEKDYLKVIKEFPKCKERELALQQEALIRGQQNDNAGMAEHFQLLLKDYPQSAAAPQAYFWIGRTAFDAKDYKRAAPSLAKSRELDKEQYFERASLPLLLCFYYLEDRAGVAREVQVYRKEGKDKVPVEVLRWLSDSYIESKEFENAELHLQLIAERDDVAARDLLKLGQTRLQMQKFAEAAPVLQKYLGSVHEPISRALGMLDLARAQIGNNDFDAARKSVEETLALQPEGKLSGEARILAGDIEGARGNWDAAARRYAEVSVILDDEEVTPRALEKAVDAYHKAGKEPEAKKILNTLQSRYPEYFQKKSSLGNWRADEPAPPPPPV